MTQAVDPRVSARGPAKTLPKRFYRAVTVAPRDSLFAVLLDARPARTPGKKLLALPSVALAEAVAAEWQFQDEFIDPFSMPLTRIANSAIEGVSGDMAAVADEIVKYAGSDLVCYRAGEPQMLADMQARAWDPVVNWARGELGARFVLAQGVMFVAQLPEAMAAVRAAVARAIGDGDAAPFRLAALSVITGLTGSALLALQCAFGACPAEGAWAAAQVDEDFQARMWGTDAEAQTRRAARWREMEAAGLMLAL